MAEGRMLKRRITASKKMAQLKSDKSRLLWFYMLPFTDVDGRIIADCEDIRDEIIRKQRKGYSSAKIEECLQDLCRVELIVLYSANSKRYLEFTRFWDEQSHNRDREAKSTIPAPTQEDSRVIKSNPLKLSKVKLSKEKEKHLDFVFLTKIEYKKIVQCYGEVNARKLIDSLNRYIGQSGKKYRSHYYTLLNFAKRDGLLEIPPPETEQQRKKREATSREKKQKEIRDSEGGYFREKTTKELKAILADPKDQQRIARAWLIKEIISERKGAKV